MFGTRLYHDIYLTHQNLYICYHSKEPMKIPPKTTRNVTTLWTALIAQENPKETLQQNK
ncbi:hypothetical protein Hanom_Chr12g01092391 [Helianthus anomalus]